MKVKTNFKICILISFLILSLILTVLYAQETVSGEKMDVAVAEFKIKGDIGI